MSSGGVTTSPSCTRLFCREQRQIFLRLRHAEWFSSSPPAAGPGRAIFSAFLFGAIHIGSLDQQVAAAAAAATTDRVRGRSRLALGRCHVRQAADAGSGVGQLLEYDVRFSQVLALRQRRQRRRQRRKRRRQRRLRWRRERRLPSRSARPRTRETKMFGIHREIAILAPQNANFFRPAGASQRCELGLQTRENRPIAEFLQPAKRLHRCSGSKKSVI